MTSQQMICPRSPVVGGDCDVALCIHKGQHTHLGDCDHRCGVNHVVACIPYPAPASQPAKPVAPDDKVPEPSDAERAAWTEATREYVDAIEIDNAAHGYSLSVVRRHFGLPEGHAYSELCDEWDRLTAERDAARSTITALNRRCQAAESLIAKSGIVEGRPQGDAGRSVGRALANYAAAKYERERDAARAECERLREAIIGMMDADAIYARAFVYGSGQDKDEALENRMQSRANARAALADTGRHACTMDAGCQPECCAQRRAGGECANTGGGCEFRKLNDLAHRTQGAETTKEE